MANTEDFKQAIEKVRNNTANQHDIALAKRAASQKSSLGDQATQAMNEANRSGKFAKHWLLSTGE